MTDTSTKPNLDWESRDALTIRLGDQIKVGAFWRPVTGVRITPGVEIAVWFGERLPATYPAGAQVMVRTIEQQAARKEAAKDTLDKLVAKVQAKASGWLSKLAAKVGAR
jgi:ethanolamine utilization microcompartment shell protein EutL